MTMQPRLWRSPDSDAADQPVPVYSPENSAGLDQTRTHDAPVTSSPGETPYTGSHAPNYNPETEADQPGPSGENSKAPAQQGGGLWTSGGAVTTGTPYHDED